MKNAFDLEGVEQQELLQATPKKQGDVNAIFGVSDVEGLSDAAYYESMRPGATKLASDIGSEMDKIAKEERALSFTETKNFVDISMQGIESNYDITGVIDEDSVKKHRDDFFYKLSETNYSDNQKKEMEMYYEERYNVTSGRIGQKEFKRQTEEMQSSKKYNHQVLIATAEDDIAKGTPLTLERITEIKDLFNEISEFDPNYGPETQRKMMIELAGKESLKMLETVLYDTRNRVASGEVSLKDLDYIERDLLKQTFELEKGDIAKKFKAYGIEDQAERERLRNYIERGINDSRKDLSNEESTKKKLANISSIDNIYEQQKGFMTYGGKKAKVAGEMPGTDTHNNQLYALQNFALSSPNASNHKMLGAALEFQDKETVAKAFEEVLIKNPNFELYTDEESKEFYNASRGHRDVLSAQQQVFAYSMAELNNSEFTNKRAQLELAKRNITAPVNLKNLKMVGSGEENIDKYISYKQYEHESQFNDPSKRIVKIDKIKKPINSELINYYSDTDTMYKLDNISKNEREALINQAYNYAEIRINEELSKRNEGDFNKIEEYSDYTSKKGNLTKLINDLGLKKEISEFIEVQNKSFNMYNGYEEKKINKVYTTIPTTAKEIDVDEISRKVASVTVGTQLGIGNASLTVPKIKKDEEYTDKSSGEVFTRPSTVNFFKEKIGMIPAESSKEVQSLIVETTGGKKEILNYVDKNKKSFPLYYDTLEGEVFFKTNDDIIIVTEKGLISNKTGNKYKEK